jgi:hypothetical protein
LVSSREASVDWSSSPRQTHWDLYVVVAWARCHGRVVRLLSWRLLGVLLIGALVPATWLEVVSWLVERVLKAVIWDPSSGSYGFDHLSSLSVLYSFGLVLVVVFREWGSDDCI